MKRSLIKDLHKWKSHSRRKPLILQGARQVGKTWLMKEFGNQAFKKVLYFNFESSERLKAIFSPDFDIPRIITALEVESNQRITPENTLLIFDEIQEADKGLTALKYFYEQAPAYFIIAAGSLLGISIQKRSSFPVGKVDFLQLYPLSFYEFLENIYPGPLVDNLKQQNWATLTPFHTKLVEYLRLYYLIGGMPEVVAAYIENNDLKTCRSLQENILRGYENDFAKYAPTNSLKKIKMVWNSIISQLAKENRKFIYGQLKSGARAKDFQEAIDWLMDAGLILKVSRVSKPTIPLNSYANYDAFKLFFLDIGLLNAKGKLDARLLLEKNDILKEYKGAATEQFVCQQVKIKHELFYWTNSKGTSELDFLIQKENQIIPIEVKAEENLKSKSLAVYMEKFNPKIALRVSMSVHREDNGLINLPLYATNQL